MPQGPWEKFVQGSLETATLEQLNNALAPYGAKAKKIKGVFEYPLYVVARSRKDRATTISMRSLAQGEVDLVFYAESVEDILGGATPTAGDSFTGESSNAIQLALDVIFG